MMYMNISALTMEEAETMLKILDRWLRHFYTVHGVRRITSFNRRANDGIRAQIRVQIDRPMWDFVRNGVMSESLHRLHKSMAFHTEQISPELRVLEFSTVEAEI